MMICERCGISGQVVRLFDAIYDGKMSLLCERCSIIENSPIIKRPDSAQLKEFEKRTKLYNRIRTIAGLKTEKDKKDTFFIGDRLKELDKNPRLELPEENQLNLIDNFHWEIMKIRRRKGLSQKQLGDVIGESEIAIQMIEKGKFPEASESLIKKIEQFFQINLKKINETESKFIEKEKKNNKPVLIDEEGRELDTIPEEKIEHLENKDINKIQAEAEYNEIEDFDLNKTDITKITIDDLRKIHRKKIEATKLEQKEEQKKIEEKERISEAIKERERMKLEERKKEINKKEDDKKGQEQKDVFEKLGGTELLE